MSDSAARTREKERHDAALPRRYTRFMRCAQYARGAIFLMRDAQTARRR